MPEDELFKAFLAILVERCGGRNLHLIYMVHLPIGVGVCDGDSAGHGKTVVVSEQFEEVGVDLVGRLGSGCCKKQLYFLSRVDKRVRHRRVEVGELPEGILQSVHKRVQMLVGTLLDGELQESLRISMRNKTFVHYLSAWKVFKLLISVMVVVQSVGKYSEATDDVRSVFSFEFVEEIVDKLLLRAVVFQLGTGYLIGDFERVAANLVAKTFFGFLAVLLDRELGGVHNLLCFLFGFVAGLLDDLSLHFIGLGKHVGLLMTGLSHIFLSLNLSIVELLLGVLGILHALIYQVGTVFHTFQNSGPREFPKDEEKYRESHEHPYSQAEINFKKFHLLGLRLQI